MSGPPSAPGTPRISTPIRTVHRNADGFFDTRNIDAPGIGDMATRFSRGERTGDGGAVSSDLNGGVGRVSPTVMSPRERRRPSGNSDTDRNAYGGRVQRTPPSSSQRNEPPSYDGGRRRELPSSSSSGRDGREDGGYRRRPDDGYARARAATSPVRMDRPAHAQPLRARSRSRTRQDDGMDVRDDRRMVPPVPNISSRSQSRPGSPATPYRSDSGDEKRRGSEGSLKSSPLKGPNASSMPNVGGRRRSPPANNMAMARGDSDGGIRNLQPPPTRVERSERGSERTRQKGSFDDMLRDLDRMEIRNEPSRSGDARRLEGGRLDSRRDNRRLPSREAPQDNDTDIADQQEMARQRAERERLNSERRRADRLEAERVAAERERRIAADRSRRAAAGGSGGGTPDFALLMPRGSGGSVRIPTEYIKAVIQTLGTDPTVSPVPEDFGSADSYREWRQSMRMSLQDTIIRLLNLRFLKRNMESDTQTPTQSNVKLFFKIVGAKGLIAKDNRPRDTYCSIEYGDPSPKSTPQVFQTETVTGSLNPKWNQHLNLDVVRLTDVVVVKVWDRNKEKFLGMVSIGISELVSVCAREGYWSKWYQLEPRDNKNKDKYVGGNILIEAAVENKEKKSMGGGDTETFEEFMRMVSTARVLPRSLYRTLLRSCIQLDVHTPRDNRTDVVSEESATLLQVMSRVWGISESVQLISYLEILLIKYKTDHVPVSEVLKTFEILFANMKRDGWMSVGDENVLVGVLEDMQETFVKRVTRYKESFNKNKPSGALETSILILRMIQKSPSYRKAHSEIHESFREELKKMLTEAVIGRFQHYRELTTPFDEGDVEAVVEGVTKLADMVSDDIETDAKYFQQAFAIELDIVRLTAENHLKYFVLTLEDMSDWLSSDEAVTHASGMVFSLYKSIKKMDERYAKLVPGLKRLSSNAGFSAERWFSPFMNRWLEKLSEKTLDWVIKAVSADTFEPIEESMGDGIPAHSSSITDVFSAMYSELEFIMELGWSNDVENAMFYQAFAKTVNKAIEQYCDAVASNGRNAGVGAGATTTTTAAAAAAAATAAAANVAALAQNFLAGRSNGPKEIQNESCVKLRNLEYAMEKLREMYRMMNVEAVTKTMKEHRKSMMPGRNRRGMGDEKLSGTLKIHVSYGENLKPVNKNGLSNPYLVVRVPDGTVVPPTEQMASQKKKKKRGSTPDSEEGEVKATVLSGSACELLRSRVVQESLNPAWDENFAVVLPPVEVLEVSILSKNLLTSDEMVGKAVVDFSSGTKLRRKLMDNQTHDVYVELEPQGRVMMRLTMDGEHENVDFWFRRTNERLIRTRDDLIRSMVGQIMPYMKEVIMNAMKENEAAVVKGGFFAALTGSAQYSDVTVGGKRVDEVVSEMDADVALGPLTEYLDKNLMTLASRLSPDMVQEVILRTWDEVLGMIEFVLVPGLYGQMDSNRRVLNVRQTSLLEWVIGVLRDFFHADGDELGIPLKTLQTRRSEHVISLLGKYHSEMDGLMYEYERGMSVGREREYLLKLSRLRIERDPLGDKEREDLRKWYVDMLEQRREMQANTRR